MSDGLLARWARRKRAVRDQERGEIQTPVEALPPVEEAGAVSPEVPEAGAEPDADLLSALPSLEELTAETDVTPFLRAGVPVAMRNAALRRIWSVDPAIRDFVSEACDYAYDWNTPGGVPGLGPLLPGDDVQAMLGRLFNRDPSEMSEMSEMEETRDAPAESPPEASIPATAGPAEATTAPVADIARVAGADPGPDTAVEPVPAPVPTTPVTPRLRRHGGAMPS